MADEKEKAKDKINEFMERLSAKLEKDTGDEKPGRFMMQLDKKGEDFQAIARAETAFESFPIYLEEQANRVHAQWIEMKKKKKAVWDEFAIRHGLNTMRNYRVDRNTGAVYEVTE